MKKINLKIFSLTALTLFIFIIFFVSLNRDQRYDTKNIIGSKIENFSIEKFYESGFVNRDIINSNQFSLINFWASWCAPCRDEHPLLMNLRNIKNLNLIGINFKDNKKNALKFLNDLGNPYKILLRDFDGKNSISFGVYGIPESILIDQDFNVLKKYIGPINQKDFNEILEVIK